MRQKIDVGDLIEVSYSSSKDLRKQGIVLEKELITKHPSYPDDNSTWHPDEYRCKVVFLGTDDPKWVRARWLKVVSKSENFS